MSPVAIRGRQLGVQRNGVFTEANTAPIPRGRLWTEAALTWSAMHAAYVAAGGHPDEFVPTGPAASARTFRQQVLLRNEWAARGQPQKAAVPGTSNHGWGIAVDCPSPRAQGWLLRHCGEYGWSHDEGASVGEPWHFRYVGASKRLLSRLTRDPLAGFTPHERRWIAEYDRLLHEGRDIDRRRVLRRVMKQQRKRIFRAAHDRRGWTRMRKRRYAALRARTS